MGSSGSTDGEGRGGQGSYRGRGYALRAAAQTGPATVSRRRRWGPSRIGLVSGAHDRQRSRGYGWKRQVVAPRDVSFIPFAPAQGMVDAIWTEMGLSVPPEVEQLPRQATTTIASATRLSIFLSDATPSWCLLHAIAHVMTSSMEGCSNGQGPAFIGTYVRLLVRYRRCDEADLLASLARAGIAVARDARPMFVDPD